MRNLYYRVSSGIQVWLMKHPGKITGCFLTFFYVLDLVFFGLDSQAFLTRRRSALGPNFGALGRLVVGGHADVAEGIRAPQKRGDYLGPTRLRADLLSKYFLLFLSDEEAGGDGTFRQAYDTLWDLALGPAEHRQNDPEALAAVAELANDIAALGQNPPQAKDITSEVERTVVRYLLRVILQVSVTDEELDTLHTLMFSPLPWKSMIVSRVVPFAGDQLPSDVARSSAMFRALVDGSPVMAGFAAANKYDLDREAFVGLFVQVLAIAGCVGGSNLSVSALTQVPTDLEVDLDDRQEVERVVLETSRRWTPVFHINTLAQKPVTFPLRGKDQTFPEGTTVDFCIGLASLDDAVFPDPMTFNPQRPNLCPALVSFNGVGEEGRRKCPGRGIAVTMVSQIFVAWRKRLAATAA